MKLIINRRETKEGIFFKSTVYYLDVTLETTHEEQNLIKKHQWGKMPIGEGKFLSGAVMERSLDEIVGGTNSYPFKTAEHLAYFENQVLNNLKALKKRLESAAEFTSGGPREIDL